MSKRVSDLLNIDHIDGLYIYGKDGSIKVLVHIFHIPPDNQQYIFSTLLSGMQQAVQFFVLKSPMQQESVDEYFQDLIAKQLDTNLLKDVLLYRERFLSQLKTFFFYKLFLLYTLPEQGKSLYAMESALKQAYITYIICPQKDVYTLLDSII